jgi:hypothetical protein
MPLFRTADQLKAHLDAKYPTGATDFYYALFEELQSSFTFTASGTTLTATGHDFVNGTRVTVATTGTLPGGLTASTIYYVVGVSGSTLGLSATKGGSAIVTSSAGSGVHSVTEAEPGVLDSLDVWVRHEVDYAGSGRQQLTGILAATFNPSLVRAEKLGDDSLFDPSSASIVYRYIGLIAGGTSTPGDNTGILDSVFDEGASITIPVTGFAKRVKFAAFEQDA